MAYSYDEDYLNYLLESYGLSDQLSGIGTDELKDEGSYLTQASKVGNITTDRDWLLMNNAVNPRAFEPLTTFNPVDAPGWRKTQNWLTETASPFQQYVATLMETGKDTNYILADLQDLMSNPKTDFHRQVIASIPKAMVDEGTAGGGLASGKTIISDAPDFVAARNQIQSLEDLRTSDPEYTIGEDGAPVMSETKNSPMMDQLIEAGYTTVPGQPFDPYDLAPAGTYERDQLTGTAAQEALERFTKAKTAQTAARKALNEAQGVESINNDPQYERQAMMRALTQGGLMKDGKLIETAFDQRPQQLQTPTATPSLAPTPAPTGTAYIPMATLGGIDMAGRTNPNLQMSTGTRTPPAGTAVRPEDQGAGDDRIKRRLIESVVRGNLAGLEGQRTKAREEALRLAGKATVEANASKQAWQRASDADYFGAQHPGMQRAMLAQQLASQNITPFDIERKQRIALGLGR